jgi:glucose/arabinose dehydrogenase
MFVALVLVLGAAGAYLWLRHPALIHEALASPASAESRMEGGGGVFLSAAARFSVHTVARDLENPWSLAFLPSGRMLVTERPGRIRLVETDGTLRPPLGGTPRVLEWGQGGMLDLALDPQFSANHRIYVSYAAEGAESGEGTVEVASGTLDERANRIIGLARIFRAEPALGSEVQFGSRLVFGGDGKLYVSIGDRGGQDRAQDLGDDAGKILRLNADGTIPPDNPFRSRAGARPEIWSYGHRNPQGLAFNPSTGALWEHEHGPQGGDEINVIRPGLNYGWPIATYGEEYGGGRIAPPSRPGVTQPLHYWVPSIAPSGMAFYTGTRIPEWTGDLFVGALAGELLVRLTMDGERVLGREERLLTEFGERIRDVRSGPDGYLYLLTDNSEGRILRLEPAR